MSDLSVRLLKVETLVERVVRRGLTVGPSVCGRVNWAGRSNEPWVMDVTDIPCGRMPGAHLAAYSHDWEIVDHELALQPTEGTEQIIRWPVFSAFRDSCRWVRRLAQRQWLDVSES